MVVGLARDCVGRSGDRLGRREEVDGVAKGGEVGGYCLAAAVGLVMVMGEWDYVGTTEGKVFLWE